MKIKQQEEVVIGNNKSLRTFVNSINSPHTEETYVNNIKGYIEYHNIKDFDSLLEIDKEKTFEMIENYITFNRKEKQRSSSGINGIICSIRLFYSVNRYDDLNWYILARFKGKERRKMVDDRAYTREEIKKMLEYSDIRMKVAILVMLSSGVRVDGLVSIRLKDLDYNEQYKLYKIRIYSDDLNESYFTFCTPECTQFIKLYLEERERKNEVLNPDSPLIRKDFDCFRDLKL
jgi:integrase